MKTLNVGEAYHEIINAIEIMQVTARLGLGSMSATINNVAFTDFVKLYSLIHAPKKLHMPGEIGRECMSILYKPAPGAHIYINSEECVNYKPKINLINYN